jgi:hypothetical protein
MVTKSDGIRFIKIERSTRGDVRRHQPMMSLDDLSRPWLAGCGGERRESKWNLSVCDVCDIGHVDGGDVFMSLISHTQL